MLKLRCFVKTIKQKNFSRVLEKEVQEDDAWIKETKRRAESLTKEIQENRVKMVFYSLIKRKQSNLFFSKIMQVSFFRKYFSSKII